jgi:predicted amidohydrolase YtcJ
VKIFCSITLLAAIVPSIQAQSGDTGRVISGGGIPSIPDVVYLHGDILTGAHLRASDTSAAPARVTAIAVRSGRILAVGSDAEMLKLKSGSTKVVDLNGAFAMPGFNDAHTHIAGAGQQHLTVDLTGSASLAEMQARIRAYVASPSVSVTPTSWIKGGGWDHTLWAGKKLPTKTDLDAVTGAHPAVFERVDGHILVANSAALAAAGISAETPSPGGGQIDHDAAGEPTGILRESSAMALVNAKIPPPSNDVRRRALEFSIADALAHGVTSVQDFSDWEDFLVLEEMEHAHQLHLRVSEWLAFGTSVAVLKERRASHDAGDPLLHLGMLKAFMDGSLGSRTAAMEDPYSDDPGNSGLLRYPDQAKLNQMAAERAAAGFQLGFHAIGDRANQVALDAFEAAEQVARTPGQAPAPKDPGAGIVEQVEAAATPAALRFRVEHAQVVEAGDFDRFARLGVIASMQPSHLLTDMNWAAARLGPERTPLSYTWKSFLDHKVTLAFGTDYPVESIDPFRGLYSAVTRQNEAGTQTYQPQERISINEAIYAYTQASAFAEFRETEKGRLEPGFLADFVVLDRDPTKAAPKELLHTKVLRTIVSGETVFAAGTAK